METIRRTLDFEVRVDKAKEGRVTYCASTPTVDSHREIVVPAGARPLLKNTPFVNSHRHSDIRELLGKVVEAYVRGGKLYNVVDFALGVGNELAELAYRMVKAGMLPACSIGFMPIDVLRYGDSGFDKKKKELGVAPEEEVRCIYLSFQQLELSAVILPSNGDALLAAKRWGGHSFKQATGPGSAARRLVDEAVARLPFPSAVTSEQRRKIAADILPFPEVFE